MRERRSDVMGRDRDRKAGSHQKRKLQTADYRLQEAACDVGPLVCVPSVAMSYVGTELLIK